MHGTEKNIILTHGKFVTIYLRSTLHDTTEFCKNTKFGTVALGFHYGSCFNASLSHYTLKFYFVFKKLILRK